MIEEHEARAHEPVRFVRDFVDVALDFEVAVPLLTMQDPTWLSTIANQVAPRDEGLRAVLGLRAGPLRTPVEVRLATPRRTAPDEVQIPMTWSGALAPWLFPRLDGLLGISKVAPQLSQLWLEGSYRPPLGRPGLLIDQALLYRVADSTVRRFLELVASSLVELAQRGA